MRIDKRHAMRRHVSPSRTGEDSPPPFLLDFEKVSCRFFPRIGVPELTRFPEKSRFRASILSIIRMWFVLPMIFLLPTVGTASGIVSFILNTTVPLAAENTSRITHIT